MHAKTYLIPPWIQPLNFRRRCIICASAWYGAPKTVKFIFPAVHALKSLIICAFGRIASRCNFLKRFKSSGSWSNVYSMCVVKARRNTKQNTSGQSCDNWMGLTVRYPQDSLGSQYQILLEDWLTSWNFNQRNVWVVRWLDHIFRASSSCLAYQAVDTWDWQTTYVLTHLQNTRREVLI